MHDTQSNKCLHEISLLFFLFDNFTTVWNWISSLQYSGDVDVFLLIMAVCQVISAGLSWWWWPLLMSSSSWLKPTKTAKTSTSTSTSSPVKTFSSWESVLIIFTPQPLITVTCSVYGWKLMYWLYTCHLYALQIYKWFRRCFLMFRLCCLFFYLFSVFRVKTKTSAKYGLEAQPRLVDIIAAVPPQYRRALVPKLKAKPIRTASGVRSTQVPVWHDTKGSAA